VTYQRLPRDKHENACNEQDPTEASEEVTHVTFEPPRRRLTHLIRAMFAEAALDLVFGQSNVLVNGEAAGQLLDRKGVPFEISQIYDGVLV
jgi:hypothetical protein